MSLPSLLIALFLAAHGLVHVSFVRPAPAPAPGAPQWPFDLERSWLLGRLGLDATATRVVGLALLVVVVAGYVAAAAAAAGFAPASWFPPMVTAASIASLAMLGLYFHPWLVLGIVIDLGLLFAVLANGWNPARVA